MFANQIGGPFLGGSATKLCKEFNQVQTRGGPASEGPGPANQAGAAAGQSSEERQDRAGSPSRAGVRQWGQAKQLFRLKSNQVIEMQGGPSNDGSGTAHVSRVTMPTGQDAPRHRDQAVELDPSLLPNYVIEDCDSAM